jgi:cytochrome c oxidase assembly protein subunit 15
MNPIDLAPAPVHRNASSAPLARFAWIVLAYSIATILWGGVVRATGSGAGCGEHWPLCNGTVVQHSIRTDTMIELAHRVTSGISLIAVFVLAYWTWIATPKKHLARAAAVAAVVLSLNEALLGALLVILRKVAMDQSASRGVYLALHFTNTLLMVAALTLTAHFLGRSTGYFRKTISSSSLPVAVVGLVATLFVGVSGSIAALGDTLFPATSLHSAIVQDFSATAAWLLRLRWLHPALAVVAGGFLIWLLHRAITCRGYFQNGRLAWLVAGLLLLQYGLGIADVLLLAPTWMQIIHLLGADILWTALVVLTARLCLEPVDTIAR